MSNDRAVEDFHRAIAGYADRLSASISYVARLTDPLDHVIKARLQLHGSGMLPEQRVFRSAELIAGTFHLATLEQKPVDVVRAALDGRLVTPEGEFALPAAMGGSLAATFVPLHPELLAQQTRVGVLQIRGSDQLGHHRNHLLDWSVRSAPEPYDGLNDLSVAFGLGGVAENSIMFEAVAPTLVQVDVGGRVVDGSAHIGLVGLRGLDWGKASIGYRVLDKGQVTDRGSVPGHALEWRIEDARIVGSTTIAVAPAAAVQCYARYDDVTYHSYWIADPTLVQNPRRSAYERFDPELTGIRALLGSTEKRFSREFEAAVASLLWMLGFNTCNFGAQRSLQEGPDVVGTTAEGHVVVVECTTGGLKTDSKMQKLLRRTAAVRERLIRSGYPHLRILPVMATSLPTTEVQAELDDAAAAGVYVLTGEGLSEALNRTFAPPHADQLFVEAERSMASAIDPLAIDAPSR